MNDKPLDVVRACLQAYVDKDRASIEALLDDDYHFTSPLDNEPDRAAYLDICWPNSAAIGGFEDIYRRRTVTAPSSCTRPARRQANVSAIAKCTPYATASSSRPRSISAGTYRTQCRRVSTSIASRCFASVAASAG
jgi:hypothetical protein